jgi:hypothetical protein
MSRVLFTLAFASSAVACLSQVPSSTERKKAITVEMKWQKGGLRTGDVVSLHFQRGSVDCSLNFAQPKEVEKYIETFGPSPVPVTFAVSFDRTGRPSGALLIKVGEWDANRFPPNQTGLSMTFKLRRTAPGEVTSIRVGSPEACFDPMAPQ